MNITISGYEKPEILRAVSAFLLDLARVGENSPVTTTVFTPIAVAPEVAKTPAKKSKPAPTPVVEDTPLSREAAAESPSEEPPFDGGTVVSGPTLEEVRAVLVKLSEAGKAERCKALIQGQGVKSLSELKDQPAKLADLLKAAQEQINE